MFNVRVLPNTHADIKSAALEKKKNSFEIYICCARDENQGIYRNRHAQILISKCIKDYSCNLYDINVSKFCNKPVRL